MYMSRRVRAGNLTPQCSNSLGCNSLVFFRFGQRKENHTILFIQTLILIEGRWKRYANVQSFRYLKKYAFNDTQHK